MASPPSTTPYLPKKQDKNQMAAPQDTSKTLPLKDWQFAIDVDKIAWATFDRQNESMNSLGRRPLQELEEIISAVEELSDKAEIRGLVFMSGKKDNFIAGADIREFSQFKEIHQAEELVRNVTALFDRVENLRIPVVCAVHGYCLGGGLEFALTCDYIIADREDGTRFGFPEVRLGIIPGLHGTARSLFRAGVMGAMPTMLTGRMLRSPLARRLGFVDQLVPTRHSLHWAARKAVLQERKSRKLSFSQKLMLTGPARKLVARKMRKETAKKVNIRHYPAPFNLINLFEEFGDSEERMRIAETRFFAPLLVSETSRNLRRVFTLSEQLKKQVSAEAKKQFRPLRVHIVGAGTMGGDIAAWCVVCGMQASIQDLSVDQIEVARKRAKTLFKKRLKKKLAIDAAMTRLITDVEGTYISHADVIIEAVVERLDIKQKVLSGLESKMKAGAVLATNTSSLPLEDIAKSLKDPKKLIGLHFFNPVAKMPLVEVIRGKASSQKEIDKGCAFVAAIKKFPVIVKSHPGFLVNRVLAPYMMEAISQHEKGVKAEDIDNAALDFGMPMGPIELVDVVGLDIIVSVAETLGIATPPGSKLERLIEAGHLGQKSGQGFYSWVKGKPKKNFGTMGKTARQDLANTLIHPLLSESKRCVEEGIVASEDLVDAGIIFGTGFAPFRGGPLHYRKTLDQDVLARKSIPAS